MHTDFTTGLPGVVVFSKFHKTLHPQLEMVLFDLSFQEIIEQTAKIHITTVVHRDIILIARELIELPSSDRTVIGCRPTLLLWVD